MITLECNYSKKLGLPGYSSHQFSITLRTEISALAKVHAESNRLYKLLQNGVDSSIREVGYLPDQNGKASVAPSNGNGHNDAWSCSDKQRSLILKIVDDHKLDKNDIEQMAQDRFTKSVKKLNKLEASGLIEELLEKYGDPKANGRGGNRYQKAGGR